MATSLAPAALEPALLVGVGGTLGALARFMVASLVETRTRDTLVVNVLGSLALGALVAAPVGRAALLVVGTGFCGAFTTFSTFAVETLASYESAGDPGAARNVALHVLGSLVAVGLGAAVVGAVV